MMIDVEWRQEGATCGPWSVLEDDFSLLANMGLKHIIDVVGHMIMMASETFFHCLRHFGAPYKQTSRHWYLIKARRD